MPPPGQPLRARLPIQLKVTMSAMSPWTPETKMNAVKMESSGFIKRFHLMNPLHSIETTFAIPDTDLILPEAPEVHPVRSVRSVHGKGVHSWGRLFL